MQKIVIEIVTEIGKPHSMQKIVIEIVTEIVIEIVIEFFKTSSARSEKY